MIWFLTQAAVVVVHTPLWVWVLYALLLYLGFQRTRDSTLPLWRMLILPVVVAALAVFSVIGAGVAALPAILPGLAIGLAAGWHLEAEGATRRLPDGSVWVQGEWWSFTQIALVLIFRYATSVIFAIDHSLAVDPVWRLSTLFTATALSALFLGRIAARLRHTLRSREGRLEHARVQSLERSSNRSIATVRRAAPFPPIPADAGRSTWSFILPLRFR